MLRLRLGALRSLSPSGTGFACHSIRAIALHGLTALAIHPRSLLRGIPADRVNRQYAQACLRLGMMYEAQAKGER
jgi:hypothetical protein